jgi:hypothetical protein
MYRFRNKLVCLFKLVCLCLTTEKTLACYEICQFPVNYERHIAECSISFIVMLSVFMLNVIMLNVSMLNIGMLSVSMLNIVMLSVVRLN